jgi:hypothetical protein
MSRECNERMCNLAYRLGHCGKQRNDQAIEWELQAPLAIYSRPAIVVLVRHAT